MDVKVSLARGIILLVCIAALFLIFWIDFGPNRIRNFAIVIAVFVVLWIITIENFFENCYVMFKTLPRDFLAVRLFIKFRLKVRKFLRGSNVPEEFRKQFQKNPNKVCLMNNECQLTFKEVEEFSNRVANVFHQAGFKQGDVVALYMESVPQYICIWLGLAKIGVVTALVNYNLKLASFAHTVDTAKSKALIFSTALSEAVVESMDLFSSKLDYYYYGEDNEDKFPFAMSLNDAMAAQVPDQIHKPQISCTDPLIYIYTSGTTGLPKAAILTNTRYYLIAIATNVVLKDDDIYYEPLPVYHTAGGIMGVGQAVCCGVTVFIKKKFSASQFWNDCIQYNCTVSQYLGETCRYILAQPPKPEDSSHRVRLMIGSGLRSNIWEPFVQRFGVKILEVYGSTEGNANIVNIEGKVGAVGFIPSLFSSILPCALVKVDEKTGLPLRTNKGLCVECKRGEIGEFVGKIATGNPERRFDGYVNNKEATEKKIYRDVFAKGDLAFASGDILVMDRYGYLYFKDRTGDTFRWKSENVSTNEVEAVISKNINLNDSVVYGVEIPNCEGKAGMAAILDTTNSVDLDQLYECLTKELPPYARPLFIRITDSLSLTGTFKLKKIDLQNDGYDPSKCGNDKLYYLNQLKYSLLTEEIYNDICTGKIRY